MWSEEEWKELRVAWSAECPSFPFNYPVMGAVATRAVELVRARGGTMTAHELRHVLEWVRDHGLMGPFLKLDAHISAQGARTAVLEARLPAGMKDCTILLNRCEVGHHQLTAMNWVAHGCSTCELEALRAELSRLKPSGQVAEDREAVRATMGIFVGREMDKEGAALSRLAAGAQEAEALRARVKELEAERDVARGLAATNQDHLSACVAERDAARAEVERLGARKWIQCTSVSNECLGGCASMAEHDRYRQQQLLHEVENLRPLVALHEDMTRLKREAESRVAAVREALDAARAEVDRLKGAAARASAELRHTYRPETRDWNLVARAIRILEEATTPKMTERHPCSPTRTHDDAAKPGHPERVKERSEAMRKAALRDYAKQKDDWRPADADAYDAGSEAMRAACWEALRAECEKYGYKGTMVEAAFKAAIEGAAP